MQPTARERRIVTLGGARILATAMLATNCAQIIGIEDLPDLPLPDTTGSEKAGDEPEP